jgi:hypothetical protein
MRRKTDGAEAGCFGATKHEINRIDRRMVGRKRCQKLRLGEIRFGTGPEEGASLSGESCAGFSGSIPGRETRSGRSWR